MINIYLSMVETAEDRDKVVFIYENYYSFMCWCAGEVLGHNKHDVEDSVHNAMVSIIEHLECIDFSDKQRLKNFCGIVAKNKAINCKKSQGKNVTSTEDTINIGIDHVEMPDEIVLGRETYSVILREVFELDEKYRDVCMLKYLHGLKEREIAELLDISPKTVGTRIFRGKQLLREALRKENTYVQ